MDFLRSAAGQPARAIASGDSAFRSFQKEVIGPTPPVELTPQLCRDTCRGRGYRFAAVEYYRTCWCGNNFPQTPRIYTGCTLPCSGDARYTCGGSWKNDVYVVCRNGTFGPNCENVCHCRDNNVCHNADGSCPSPGCAIQWTGRNCSTCVDRNYGVNCTGICGSCRNMMPCDKVTGICSDGCEDGWYNDNICKTGCLAGSYGFNCSQTCGKCRDGCYSRTGVCKGGCIPGWDEEINGGKCTHTCLARRFGDECSRECSVNCKDESACNHVDGTCYNGCMPGWKGRNCTEGCSEGTFGDGCGKVCKQCLAGCNPVDGRCLPGGCADGYFGAECKTCLPGQFGDECSRDCSVNCKNESACNHVDGTCYNGCLPGWKGRNCTEEQAHLAEDNTPGCSVNLALVISLAVCVAVIVALVVVVIIQKRRLTALPAKRQAASVPQPSVVDGVYHTLDPATVEVPIERPPPVYASRDNDGYEMVNVSNDNHA